MQINTNPATNGQITAESLGQALIFEQRKNKFLQRLLSGVRHSHESRTRTAEEIELQNLAAKLEIDNTTNF